MNANEWDILNECSQDQLFTYNIDPALYLGDISTGYDQGTSLKTCIPESWRCDGEADCKYGDDETGCPTFAPTRKPTNIPTKTPTQPPTKYPSMPTVTPTQPTVIPTSFPSETPSAMPSITPSSMPTRNPTENTLIPSLSPTKNPTTPAPISSFPFSPILSDIECGDRITGTTGSNVIDDTHYFKLNLTLFQTTLLFDGCDNDYDSQLFLYFWNTTMNVNEWDVLNECDDDCGGCSGSQEQLFTYNVDPALYYLGVSGYDSYGDISTGYYSVRIICSNVITENPTSAPTLQPTNDTSQPTLIPSSTPSKPTVFYSYTSFPTLSSNTKLTQSNENIESTVTLIERVSETVSDAESNESDAEQVISVTLLRNSGLYYIVIVVTILAAIIAVGCICYLVLSKLTSRTQEIGTASVKQTFNEFGTAEKVSSVIEVFDVVTDYLFAVDLITNKEASKDVMLLGWISLFAAIIGCSFFYVKLLLAKKLIGFQIPLLKEQLSRRLSVATDTHIDNIQQTELILAMRQRRIDIDVITLLIACFEDCPQAVIVAIIVTSNIGWTYYSLMSISLSVIGFCVKCIQILMSRYGCKDPDDIHREASVFQVQTASDLKVPMSTSDLEIAERKTDNTRQKDL